MRVLKAFHKPLSCLAVALFATGVLLPGQVEAQRRRDIGTAIGVGAGLLMLNEAAKGMKQRKQDAPSTQRRPQQGADGDAPKSSKRSDQPTGAQAQNSSELRNYAQAEAERQQIEAANRMESDRNVETAVDAFITDLRRRHEGLLGGRANVRVATGLNINEVTAGQIKAAVEEAYKQAHLYEFERFAGEVGRATA
jgi:hypothetical protein